MRIHNKLKKGRNWICQEPPVKYGWHVGHSLESHSVHNRWFLSMLRNFTQMKRGLALSHKFQTGGKFLTFLVMIILLVISNLDLVFSVPGGPTSITVINSSTKTPSAASTVEALAGNITKLNIDGTTVTQSWQGYYGNISGVLTLGDSLNNTLYNWSLAAPEGEIYAAANTIDFSSGNIICFNYSANVPAEYTSLTELETSLGMASDDVDGVNETFSDSLTHTSFYTGTNSIDGSTTTTACPAVRLFNGTGKSTSGLFEEVLLYDKTNHEVIYTAIIDDNQKGFTNETIDFQMLVGENGHEGNTQTTTYYFYVELE